MRAIRFHDWGSPPVVEDVDEPMLAEGEILVRVDAAALSHLDLTVASGTFGFKPTLPYVAGVEGSGTVVTGDGIPAGTQVLLRGGGLGLLRDGTWREMVAAPAKAVSLLAEPLPAAVAATFFVPTTTAHVALHDVGGVAAGDRVAVAGGAGAVGSIAVQLARRAGAEVISLRGRPDGSDPVDGVTTYVTSAEVAARFAKERPFDLLVDTLGGSGLAERSRWVRPGGRAVAIGYVTGTDTSLHLPDWLLDDVALLPVNMIRRETQARELAPQLVRELACGELELAVEAVSPNEVPFTLERLARGRVRGRAVVAF